MAEATPVAAALVAQRPVGAGLSRWRGVLLALALGLPFLVGLGGAPLFDVDEGAFSEATREMLASGDWGHTTLNGADRFDKPIGIYWLQSLGVLLFGPHEFALRLPSALAGWAMVLAVVGFCRPRMGAATAWTAGAILATSLGVQAIARAATADAVLNLLIVLACLDLWRHVEDRRDATRRRAFAWIALGVLVKGPVAILVPGAALLLWAASWRRWDALRSVLRDPWAWLLAAAIALPWYLYALDRHGMAFVEGFLLRHNVRRFGAPMQGHAGSFLYYAVVLPLLALPWTPLLAAVVARLRGLWVDPLARYLLLWAGFVLLFFTLSGTKLPHYALYGYAPLAILMARMLAGLRGVLRSALWATVALWACLVATLPWLLASFAGSGVRDPLYRALLSGAPSPPVLPPLLAAGVLLGVLAWRGWRQLALPLCACVGIVSLLIAGWAYPWLGEALQGPVRRAASAAAAQGGERVGFVQWGVHLPSVAVYFGHPVPLRAPQAAELALARADRLPPEAARRPRLFEERGIVVLGPETRP